MHLVEIGFNRNPLSDWRPALSSSMVPLWRRANGWGRLGLVSRQPLSAFRKSV